MDISGLSVILTGATGGIGGAIKDALIKKGARLALCGRDEKKLSAIACDGAITLAGDLNNGKYLDYCVAETKRAFGKIDVLINCAGLAQSTPFCDITEQDYDRIMNTNVKAPFMLTQRAMPYLAKSDFGTVINIASVTAHIGYPLQSIYSASKHALLGLSRSLAKEFYKENVRVHVISPGGVFTDMIKIARPDLTSEGMILPSDIARSVVYLLENRDSAAVTDEIRLHRESKEPFI